MLRAVEKEDSELIREMFNDPEIENKVIGWAFPLSKFAQEKWMETHYNDLDKHFVIQGNDGVAVGIATLTDIDWKNRKAFHGMKIANVQDRHKGIGTDAVMAIMRYAFDELQLNRLDGRWFEDNLASKNMYMKCGWKEEGIRKEYIFKNGAYRDVVETGILAKEYYELMEKSHYWGNEKKD